MVAFLNSNEMEKIYTKTAITGLILLLFLPYLNAQNDNRYVTPSAIEPLTGYLPDFSPVMQGEMQNSFYAKYELVRHYGQTYGAKSVVEQVAGQKGISIVEIAGSLELIFSKHEFSATEIRNAKDGMDGIVKTKLKSKGDYHLVKSWEMESYVKGNPETRLIENGRWQYDTLFVNSKSFHKKQTTKKMLIANWSLLPLLSSGKLKTSDSFEFDMLENSTYFPDQKIDYEGIVEVQLADKRMKLDSYSHTGWGKVPTHYLVDSEGRVQLITVETVSWALKELSNK